MQLPVTLKQLHIKLIRKSAASALQCLRKTWRNTDNQQQENPSQNPAIFHLSSSIPLRPQSQRYPSSPRHLIVELQLQPQQTTLLSIIWLSTIFKRAIAVLILNGRFKVFAKFEFDSQISFADKILSRIEFLLLSTVVVLESKIRIDDYVPWKRL